MRGEKLNKDSQRFFMLRHVAGAAPLEVRVGVVGHFTNDICARLAPPPRPWHRVVLMIDSVSDTSCLSPQPGTERNTHII